MIDFDKSTSQQQNVYIKVTHFPIHDQTITILNQWLKWTLQN